MLRTSLMILGVVVGHSIPAVAQVGFRVQQTPVTSGASLSVSPVVTNGGTYVRMGISASFSQLVDVQTFSPVQNFPGLVPIAPIGFGGGINQGFNGGFGGGGVGVSGVIAAKPTVERFLVAAKKFDKDEDRRLDRKELSEVATAVIAELRRSSPGFMQKLGGKARSAGNKPPTASEFQKAFVTQCLKYDRDDDKFLDESETRRLATDLVRSLLVS